MGFEIVSEITTRETDFDGTRHDAWSDWTTTTAPDNHVINDRSVTVTWESDNGSENTHELVYSDYEEIVAGTGLKFPRTIKVRVYARSPKGMGWTGRGMSQIRVKGDYIKYK